MSAVSFSTTVVVDIDDAGNVTGVKIRLPYHPGRLGHDDVDYLEEEDLSERERLARWASDFVSIRSTVAAAPVEWIQP